MAKAKQAIPVKKGGQYIIQIVSLGHSGEGVGRYQDFTVFVPNALPGEQVVAEVTEVKQTYAKGRLVEVQNASPDRIEAKCSIYHECGGCQLQHLGYEAQLKAKRQQVVDAVTRIGKLEDILIHPTIGAENPWFYRNKMQVPVGLQAGQIVIGCYQQGTHSIINTEHCYIQHDVNNNIAREMRRIMTELDISPYNEKTGKGIVRHVLGRVGIQTGEVMVVIITATEQLPQQAQVISKLREAISGLVSIVQNINAKKTNIIMGDKTVTLWGKNYIVDHLGEFKFEISARSFFQVNTTQAEVLYNKAVEYAGLSGRETVIDAYCGTGTITLFLARHAAKVYGIEIVKPAILDARRNAINNSVTNTEFIVGDAVAVMPDLFKQGVRPEVIVVDPPRAGCERMVLETFANMKPARIVYVSCNPATLARDLAVLAEYGYKTCEIQPVDMFAQTSHVECVAVIERKYPDLKKSRV
ncbi:23S rRNA (uracil-C(5))-methyltransferase RlmCD [bioreactor metagenome]|uniref:23S rRNA (Uracil-C(5))-methyltransferase RlmCD n=1 Tax=bioreactor metagenome TaxID=1076179 RepID=A0A644TF91_9ZZZZ